MYRLRERGRGERREEKKNSAEGDAPPKEQRGGSERERQRQRRCLHQALRSPLKQLEEKGRGERQEEELNGSYTLGAYRERETLTERLAILSFFFGEGGNNKEVGGEGKPWEIRGGGRGNFLIFIFQKPDSFQRGGGLLLLHSIRKTHPLPSSA